MVAGAPVMTMEKPVLDTHTMSKAGGMAHHLGVTQGVVLFHRHPIPFPESFEWLYWQPLFVCFTIIYYLFIYFSFFPLLFSSQAFQVVGS